MSRLLGRRLQTVAWRPVPVHDPASLSPELDMEEVLRVLSPELSPELSPLSPELDMEEVLRVRGRAGAAGSLGRQAVTIISK